MRHGFTLIEMMVAVAVFTLMVTAGSGLFVSGLRAQRRALATQELLDQTSYISEYMSRAIRMAQKDMDGGCTDPTRPRLNFAFIDQCLRFRNYRDECQQFCLVGTMLRETRGALAPNYLTSPVLRVTPLDVGVPWVTLVGHTQDDNVQPKVRIFLNIEGRERSRIQIQTSISQRNLDVKR